MSYDPKIVHRALTQVSETIYSKMGNSSEESEIERFQEMEKDLWSFWPPIKLFRSVQHLCIMLPERISEIEKELGQRFQFEPEFDQLITWK